MPGDALLPIAAYADDLATSRIVVNTQTLGSRTQVKGRVAQCLASGAFLLEQDNAESRAYLEASTSCSGPTSSELDARWSTISPIQPNARRWPRGA